MYKMTSWQHVAAFCNLIATRYIYILSFVSAFAIYNTSSRLMAALEPVAFVFAIYFSSTFLKFHILEILKFRAMIRGLPLNMVPQDYTELDIRSVLRDAKVDFHDIIEIGARAGAEKGFAAFKDQFQAMKVLADRNLFSMAHASQPYVRVRLFASERPMASSMAYYGFLRPTFVLFRDKVEDLTWFQRFELLHELGHGTMKGQYMFNFFLLYSQFLLLSVFVVLATFSPDKYIHCIPLLIANFFLLLWYKRRSIDDENRADSFAIQNMRDDDIAKLRSASEKYNIPNDPAMNMAENALRRRNLIRMIDNFKRMGRVTNWRNAEIDADQTGLPSNAVEMSKYSSSYRVLAAARLCTLIFACYFIADNFNSYMWLVPLLFAVASPLAWVCKNNQDRILSHRLGIDSLLDDLYGYFPREGLAEERKTSG
jgi:hypothetical protein